MTNEIKELKTFSAKIRIAAMEALEEIGAGHIGGSMADLMAVLYGKAMKIDPKKSKMGRQRLAGSFKRSLWTSSLCSIGIKRIF